jgi:uroporphyrinogen-III synthase
MQATVDARKRKVKSILVTLPKPEGDKSPYYELAKKYNLKVDFRSFIHVEGVPAKDFRKEKINLADFTAVIFTSRNAADHFFRICEEMRYEVPSEMKYFCLSETIALYLQKYIQYRKRKIFFGKQTATDLAEVLKKHAGEKFIYPCSDVAAEETQKFLQENGYDFLISPKCFMTSLPSSVLPVSSPSIKIFLIFSRIIRVLQPSAPVLTKR